MEITAKYIGRNVKTLDYKLIYKLQWSNIYESDNNIAHYGYSLNSTSFKAILPFLVRGNTYTIQAKKVEIMPSKQAHIQFIVSISNETTIFKYNAKTRSYEQYQKNKETI